MNILITGAAGYIANHCALKLIASEHSLFGLDIIRPNNTSIFQEFYVSDYGNMANIKKILNEERIECILHCAGSNNSDSCELNPSKYYTNDFVGTIFLISSAIENNIKKFIFLSSTQVYGNIKNLSIKETSACQPTTVHGKIKLSIEQFISSIANAHDLNCIALRISDAIGMNPQASFLPPNENILYKTLKSLKNNSPITIGLTDNRIYNFIHVDDVANAVMYSIQKLNLSKFEIYNISSEKNYTLHEFLKTIEITTHQHIADLPPMENLPDDTIFDTYRARNELNWSLQFDDINYMISSTVNWIRQHE